MDIVMSCFVVGALARRKRKERLLKELTVDRRNLKHPTSNHIIEHLRISIRDGITQKAKSKHLELKRNSQGK